MSQARWIWQHPTWPRLTFDATRLAGRLALAREAAGRLLGKAESIGMAERASIEREVWARDAVATAAIEGETLDLDTVRSSVARRLGLQYEGPATPRDADGLLDVMENATHDWKKPLSAKQLCTWHAYLFPAGTMLRPLRVGAYRRDSMQIVSGPVGREKVHYEGVPAAALKQEMRAFLDWFNESRNGNADGLVRAGLSHVWFESIHPFDDGNGRIGRAIVDLALAQDAGRSTRMHGVATAMRQHQAEYYAALNEAQRGQGDVTDWLDWFLRIYTQSCRDSAALIDEALARARFWSDRRDLTVNAEQRKALNRMLDAGPGRFEGGLTARKYQGITGSTKLTASRHLADLVAKGFIVRAEGAGGRSTRYDLAIPGWEWIPPSR
jgi:Fic family protein